MPFLGACSARFAAFSGRIKRFRSLFVEIPRRRRNTNKDTPTIAVSLNNISQKKTAKPKYTHVKLLDEDGLLLAEQYKENSGTVNGESMALDELTVKLPKDKTVSLVTVEGQSEINPDRMLSAGELGGAERL